MPIQSFASLHIFRYKARKQTCQHKIFHSEWWTCYWANSSQLMKWKKHEFYL
jgi:hypothetical protein